MVRFFASDILPFIAGAIAPEWFLRLSKPVVIYPFYHTVSDEYLPHIHPLYKPKTAKAFGKDIEFLSRYFDAVTIDAEKLTKHAFHLSFDDGLRGVYETVCPLLFRKGIPATVFINSDFVDNRRLFYRHKAALLIDKLTKQPVSKAVQKEISTGLGIHFSPKHSLQANIRQLPYLEKNRLDTLATLLEVDFQLYLKKNRPYLTTSELKEMQGKGFAIGAHSIDHPPYSELDETEQIRQTVESCNYVKENFREKRAYFSFPFSDEGISGSFFEAVAGKVDLSFGITGIHFQNRGKHAGRIDMEKNGRNAREIINKAFLKYKINSLHI
ncbi:MAG: polysaccharide deacetylase family protein [Dysgonamonadaceae bacterium]|jgi:peptidoglycan/xylan/chitin deacetylase (PgdA/CDA1 family)|nr:polysaccharide deacetylase family protein [Dysgonamonadaceae bacterium]